MLPKSRFAFAGFVILVSAFMLNYTAFAATNQGPLAAGTTRYAVASATSSVSTTAISFVNLPGLSTTIVIPSGKKGDVMVSFCGLVSTSGYMEVRALIGGVVATPPMTYLMKLNPSAENRCANFYRLSVPSGNVNVHMEWQGKWQYEGMQIIDERSMFVTANIH